MNIVTDNAQTISVKLRHTIQGIREDTGQTIVWTEAGQ